VRVALAALLGAGVVGLALVAEPGSFAIAALAMLGGFLLAGAKTAIDLIDLNPADLTADAVTLAALGTGLALFTSGDALLVGGLLAAALAAQGLPLAVTMARCPHRSTSPPMPPPCG
jgi:hypothetical protein